MNGAVEPQRLVLLLIPWIIVLSVVFGVFTVVTVKNAVFWDVTPCGSCKNGRFGRMYHLHHQGDKNWQSKNNVSSN
jgi:hypothetical protein